MKTFAILALVGLVSAAEPAKAAAAPLPKLAVDGKDLSFFDFDNAKMIWKGDWNMYRESREMMNTCKLAESDNWKGAQQCKFFWECRGARTCERGGWCSGYDGCDETPLPMQAPGLEADH